MTEEPETHAEPDEDAQVAVQPHDEETLRNDAQDAARAHATGFNPDAPVARSAPPPEALSGTPVIPGEDNEALASGSSHTESGTAGGTDDIEPPPDAEPGPDDEEPEQVQ